MKTIVVLGGGIGGLAASYYLSKSPQVTKVTQRHTQCYVGKKFLPLHFLLLFAYLWALDRALNGSTWFLGNYIRSKQIVSRAIALGLALCQYVLYTIGPEQTPYQL